MLHFPRGGLCCSASLCLLTHKHTHTLSLEAGSIGQFTDQIHWHFKKGTTIWNLKQSDVNFIDGMQMNWDGGGTAEDECRLTLSFKLMVRYQKLGSSNNLSADRTLLSLFRRRASGKITEMPLSVVCSPKFYEVPHQQFPFFQIPFKTSGIFPTVSPTVTEYSQWENKPWGCFFLKFWFCKKPL